MKIPHLKALSSFPFFFASSPPHNPSLVKIPPPSFSSQTLSLDSNNSNSNDRLQKKKIVERGIEFDVGESFFRTESAIARDLAILSASLHRRSNGELRVLDSMCGCGIRSLRYLRQANADFVWANDANESYRNTILSNLSTEVRVLEGGIRRWVVTHSDANRVLLDNYLHREFFDLVDVDSFGSDSVFLRSAISALKIGGLLYVTSTDGYSSRGHRPQNSLASYGAYIRPMPFSNEVGLRVLIGGVLREAAIMGFHISPLFSYYSCHGPVFRVMLRVNRGKLPQNRHYGFISYCNQCGDSQAFSWNKLGHVSCLCSNGQVSSSVVMSGPLWTGPLHDGHYVTEMLQLAEECGWTWAGKEGKDLEKLLKQFIDESDPELSFGFIKMDEMASRAKIDSPPLRTMISTLHEEGYAASRSHIAEKAIKTNCPMTLCIQIARKLQKC